jgi:hypothetical protein
LNNTVKNSDLPKISNPYATSKQKQISIQPASVHLTKDDDWDHSDENADDEEIEVMQLDDEDESGMKLCDTNEMIRMNNTNGFISKCPTISVLRRSWPR